MQRKYSNNICFCGVYIKFLTLPSKCCCRNLDSSDQAIFFSNFGEPVKIVGTVSCAYVTGMAPAAVGYLHESLRCCADHAELLYTLHILCKRFFFKLIILSPWVHFILEVCVIADNNTRSSKDKWQVSTSSWYSSLGDVRRR